MADDQYALCWNNYNKNLTNGFHSLYSRGDFTDVTLSADGQVIHAHRMVLAVCSPYFRSLFEKTPVSNHPIIFLKDVSFKNLTDLVQFMYCGEVHVKQDDLTGFIAIAENLQIKGLTEAGVSDADDIFTSKPVQNTSVGRSARAAKRSIKKDSEESTPAKFGKRNSAYKNSSRNSRNNDDPLQRFSAVASTSQSDFAEVRAKKEPDYDDIEEIPDGADIEDTGTDFNNSSSYTENNDRTTGSAGDGATSKCDAAEYENFGATDNDTATTSHHQRYDDTEENSNIPPHHQYHYRHEDHSYQKSWDFTEGGEILSCKQSLSKNNNYNNSDMNDDISRESKIVENPSDSVKNNEHARIVSKSTFGSQKNVEQTMLNTIAKESGKYLTRKGDTLTNNCPVIKPRDSTGKFLAYKKPTIDGNLEENSGSAIISSVRSRTVTHLVGNTTTGSQLLKTGDIGNKTGDSHCNAASLGNGSSIGLNKANCKTNQYLKDVSDSYKITIPQKNHPNTTCRPPNRDYVTNTPSKNALSKMSPKTDRELEPRGIIKTTNIRENVSDSCKINMPPHVQQNKPHVSAARITENIRSTSKSTIPSTKSSNCASKSNQDCQPRSDVIKTQQSTFQTTVPGIRPYPKTNQEALNRKTSGASTKIHQLRHVPTSTSKTIENITNTNRADKQQQRRSKIRFISSQRGRPLLVIGDYIYRRYRPGYWRCIRTLTARCNSVLSMRDGRIQGTRYREHTHPCETTRLSRSQDLHVRGVADDLGIIETNAPGGRGGRYELHEEGLIVEACSGYLEDQQSGTVQAVLSRDTENTISTPDSSRRLFEDDSMRYVESNERVLDRDNEVVLTDYANVESHCDVDDVKIELSDSVEYLDADHAEEVDCDNGGNSDIEGSDGVTIEVLSNHADKASSTLSRKNEKRGRLAVMSPEDLMSKAEGPQERRRDGVGVEDEQMCYFMIRQQNGDDAVQEDVHEESVGIFE